MVDIDYVQGWLEFQSLDEFDAPADVLEKWIYSPNDSEDDVCSNVVDEPLPSNGTLLIAPNDNEEKVGNLKNQVCDVGIHIEKMSLNVQECDEDKENSHRVPIKSVNTVPVTDLFSNASIQDLTRPFNQQKKEEVDDDDELSLSELPKFKKEKFDNILEDSLCIAPNILDKNDGEIPYYESIDLIKDKTWLPRNPQHHRLKMRLLQSKDSSFQYFKNPNCPKSNYGDLTKEHSSLFSHYRYYRKLKSSGKIEVMCRLCRGRNWVPKEKFNLHMAFSHGILLPNQQKNPKLKPILLPKPTSLFISKSRQFTDFSVKCPKCETWIKLGMATRNNKSSAKNGLYFNYFSHYLKNHKTRAA